MPGTININEATVEGDAAVIANASSAFTSVGLSSTDGESTISANANSQNAYNKAQESIADFGETLNSDVANIRSLNLKFKEFDELINIINSQN